MAEESTKFESKETKWQKISVSMIAERNIPNVRDISADEMADALLMLSHVRLDREKIRTIDDLDCLGPVTNLYLQKNEIDKIQNLEVLPKLRFITLAENKIKKVENLKMLNNLKFLDLSDNMIEDFDTEEFPSGLTILRLKGNPCEQSVEYKSKVLQGLPALQQLDGEMIPRGERVMVGHTVERDSESGEEEDTESDGDDEITQGDLKQHCNDIIVRAKIRAMKQEKEHEKRMEELAHFRDLHALRKSARPSSEH